MADETCSTCKWFILMGRGKHTNGECHLNPMIYQVRLSEYHWCSQHAKGQQRKPAGYTEKKQPEVVPL